MWRRVLGLVCLTCFLGVGSAYALTADDIMNKRVGEEKKENVARTVVEKTVQFCKEGETGEECYKRYSQLFHESFERNKEIFNECVKRAGRMFPQDVVESLARKPVIMENGEKVSLWAALQVLGSENTTMTTACVLALTHAIADDMARTMGIPNIPETNYLNEFDKKEKEMRGKSK